MNKPKIFVIHGKSGCCYWRTWQFAETAQKNGLADVRIATTKTMSQDEVAQGLKWCDVAHIRGLLDKDGLETLLRYQHAGIKVATDYDDLFFNASPFNIAYRNFGMDDVRVRDPLTGDETNLWEDGKNGFDIKRNTGRFQSYKAILQNADLVTTTTLYLKGALSEISGLEDNLRVVPNAINFNLWKPIPVREQFKDKFRFGWAVSNSHAEDWFRIQPVLKEFLQTHPDAMFVCIGDASMEIKGALPQGQVEWYPFSDLWEGHYPMRMAMLGLDVGIAPLANLEFNKCKSPLKFAEYTAFGWPTIAQNMEPYSSHIVNGETGFLADTKEEWLNVLNYLHKDITEGNSIQAKKIHYNALHSVKQMFDLEKVTQEWVDIYKDLILGTVKI